MTLNFYIDLLQSCLTVLCVCVFLCIRIKINGEVINIYKNGRNACLLFWFIRCGPDEERILDVVPREDGARNSG
jgi:hypothetical protein